MKQIVFFESPLRKPFFLPYSGIASLISYLEQKKIKSKIIHHDLAQKIWEHYINRKKTNQNLKLIHQKIKYIRNPINRYQYLLAFLILKNKIKNIDYTNSKEELKLKKLWNEKINTKKIHKAYSKLYTPLLLVNIINNKVLFDPIYSISNHFCFQILKDLFKNKQNPIFDSILKNITIKSNSILCFSVSFKDELETILSINEKIKKQYKGLKTVIGGSEITRIFKNKQINNEQFTDVDFLIVSEGEEALLKLVKDLEQNINNSNHTNVIDLKKYNRPQINYPKSIESFPPPNFSYILDDEYYTSRPLINYSFSRGCSWGKCAQCDFSLHEGPFRSKSPKKVVEELIELNKKHNCKYFSINNNNSEPPFVQKMCELLISKKTSFQWGLCLRVSTKSVNNSMLALMKKAGCDRINVGGESGSQKYNDLINKGVNLNDMKKFLKMCHKQKIYVTYHCIYGFPNETLIETIKTIFFPIFNTKKYDIIHYHKLYIPKNSKIYQNPNKYGIKKINRDGSFVTKHNENIIVKLLGIYTLSNIVNMLLSLFKRKANAVK